MVLRSTTSRHLWGSDGDECDNPRLPGPELSLLVSVPEEDEEEEDVVGGVIRAGHVENKQLGPLKSIS